MRREVMNEQIPEPDLLRWPVTQRCVEGGGHHAGSVSKE
jgi:hypothetical protein